MLSKQQNIIKILRLFSSNSKKNIYIYIYEEEEEEEKKKGINLVICVKFFGHK